MSQTINLTRLTDEEWDQLLSAVGHHSEVLETVEGDEKETLATYTLLRLLTVRPAVLLKVTDLEHDILVTALEHHEDVYGDAVRDEDELQPWLGIYRATVALRAKLGG